MRVWFLILLTTVALAGCAESDATDRAPEQITLAAGQGAIQGLLVDDRFRPLELTDDPRTEFQRDGFILVQETGQQLRTDENGEFVVADLAPGTYTLRPNVEGHEGTPVVVDVHDGEWAEANLVVRRVVQLAEDATVTIDQTVMMTCQSQTGWTRLSLGKRCMADLSDQGANSYAAYDLTEYQPVYGVVLESLFSQAGDYELWIAGPDNIVVTMYEIDFVFDSDYGRQLLIPGAVGQHPQAPDAFDPTHFWVWPNAAQTGSEETWQMTPAPVEGRPIGVGMTLQFTVRQVMTAFLTPDNPDMQDWALLR